MLEELQRMVIPHLQARALTRALVGGGEIPSWFEIRAAFDAALAAPPEKVNLKVDVMRTAVGLEVSTRGHAG